MSLISIFLIPYPIPVLVDFPHTGLKNFQCSLAKPKINTSYAHFSSCMCAHALSVYRTCNGVHSYRQGKVKKMSGTSTSANECPSTSAVSVFTECFASPPEPRFHESQSSITAELLQDYLELLTRKNEATINSATPGVTTLFKDRNTVLFLFELCRHLGYVHIFW